MAEKDDDDQVDPKTVINPKVTLKKREEDAEGRPPGKPPDSDYAKKFSKPFTSEEQRKAQLAREEYLRKRKFPELDKR